MLHRLLDVDVGQGKLGGSFGLTEFVQYALTTDLLEGEMVDALAEGRSTRPGIPRAPDDQRTTLAGCWLRGGRHAHVRQTFLQRDGTYRVLARPPLLGGLRGVSGGLVHTVVVLDTRR